MPLGLDPATNAAADYFAGDAIVDAAGFGGGGTHISPGHRLRNELNDVRNELFAGGQLTPEEAAILNLSEQGFHNLTPDQLLGRYRTIGESDNQRFVDWYANAAGASDPNWKFAYDTFKQTFGREATASEFAQLMPLFQGAEGRTRGGAAIASMFDAYKQSPEYLRTQAGQYSDELDPVFDQMFGRDFTDSELDYFGSQMAGGRSQFEIEQMLRQLPEFQQAEDKRFRTSLASELEGYDTSFFNKAKENVISRSARNMGGAGQSSALDFALTNLMGEIAEKRGQYLAGLSSQQYGGNKDAARADYTFNRDRYFGEQEYNRRRSDLEEDYYRSRGDQDRDYERQKEDYFQMIGRSNQGRNTLHSGDWINLGLQGANAYARGAGGGGSPYDFLNY